MILLQIRDKLDEAQEATAKAELILSETFDELAINESVTREDLIYYFKSEIIENPKNERVIKWICGSGQICRKLGIVADYILITKKIMQEVEEEMRSCIFSHGDRNYIV